MPQTSRIMKSIKLNPIFIFAAAIFAGHANGAVLALYANTNAANTNASNTQVTSQSNGAAPVSGVTTTAITGNRLNNNSANFFVRNQFGTDLWITGSSPSGAGGASSDLWIGSQNQNWGNNISPGTTPATDHYFQFGLVADPGQTLDLSNMTFNWQAGINNQTTTGDFRYQLFASVNGGAYSSVNSLATKSVGNGLGGSTTDWGTITIENIDLNSLDGAQSVTFRLAMGQSFNPGNSGSYVQLFRNITVNGAAIPEPSSALLGGLGLLALLRRRR